MNTRHWLGLSLLLALCALPEVARANGVALEVGVVWAAPQEPALRAVEDRADTLSALGLGGAWTLSRIGDFRTDLLASWAWSDGQAHVGADDVRTHLTEHAFELGGRLRWARLYFLQPYVSVRAGPAFAWTDVRGRQHLDAFDVAARIEPAVGFEAFLPFSALAGRLPGLWSRTPAASGWPGAGLGLGLEVGYRFQTPYTVDAEPPEPQDDAVAADAIPRDGPHLGRLTLSGIRMGVDVTVRF
jgi:hypothetical protein